MADDGYAAEEVAQEQRICKILGVQDLSEASSRSALALAGERIKVVPTSLCGLSHLVQLKLHCNHLKRLPDTLDRLTSLTELDVSQNHLCEVPAAMGRLSSLVHLDISCNRLTELPWSLVELSKLKLLQAMYNQLAHLPDYLGNMASLEQINVSSNRLTTLPDSFHELVCLQEGRFKGNSLEELPDSFCLGLESLKVLSLASNALHKLPLGWGRLRSMQHLDLGSNKLNALPSDLCQNPSISHIDLHDNPLEELPAELGSLLALSHLDVSSTNVMDLPYSLMHLPNLATIDLRGSPVAMIPKGPTRASKRPFDTSIARVSLAVLLLRGKLIQVKLLDGEPDMIPKSVSSLLTSSAVHLESFGLAQLPHDIGELKGVKELYVHSNQIRELPLTVFQLEDLTVLSAGRNQLAELPASVGRLAALRELHLNENALQDLPNELCDLHSLQILCVESNKLRQLPEHVGQLGCLTKLALQGNPLAELPASFDELEALQWLNLRETPFAKNLLRLLGSTTSSYRCLRMVFCMHRYDSLQHVFLQNAQKAAVPDIFNGIGGPPPVGLPSGSFNPLGGIPFSHNPAGDKSSDIPQDTASHLREKAAKQGDSTFIKQSLEVELEDCDSASSRRRLLRNFFLEWHPDKRPGMTSVATDVFQWLQAQK